jgi:hypothetical protein
MKTMPPRVGGWCVLSLILAASMLVLPGCLKLWPRESQPVPETKPYAGVGLGLFWFTTPTSTANSAVRPGLNVLAGTRVFVTKQMALFGEYKYNHTSFPGDGFKADYHAHFVVFGVGYHF